MHYKIRKLAQAIYRYFFREKNLKIFIGKILILFFNTFAQNICSGYTLEPPRRGGGGSNEYPRRCFGPKVRKFGIYPCKPQFFYIGLQWGS